MRRLFAFVCGLAFMALLSGVTAAWPQASDEHMVQVALDGPRSAVFDTENDGQALQGIRQYLEEHLEQNIRAKSARPNRGRIS